jgi:hypothetical protein
MRFRDDSIDDEVASGNKEPVDAAYSDSRKKEKKIYLEYR